MYDVSHPDIETSVMYHIGKAVGKTTFAPEFMIKEYLTDPATAQAMTSYVFDKSELEKL
jgi:hypothetical protein